MLLVRILLYRISTTTSMTWRRDPSLSDEILIWRCLILISILNNTKTWFSTFASSLIDYPAVGGIALRLALRPDITWSLLKIKRATMERDGEGIDATKD